MQRRAMHLCTSSGRYGSVEVFVVFGRMLGFKHREPLREIDRGMVDAVAVLCVCVLCYLICLQVSVFLLAGRVAGRVVVFASPSVVASIVELSFVVLLS